MDDHEAERDWTWQSISAMAATVVAMSATLGYVTLSMGVNPDTQQSLRSMTTTIKVCGRLPTTEHEPLCAETADRLERQLNSIYNGDRWVGGDDFREPHFPSRTRAFRWLVLTNETRREYLRSRVRLNTYLGSAATTKADTAPPHTPETPPAFLNARPAERP